MAILSLTSGHLEPKKHETEVEGIGMCREAGGFSSGLLIKPWRSTFWLYFTLLYWIEADTNPGLLPLKKEEMRKADD